ncbi:transmembrane protein 19-like [Dreissena polymorpha]|uniref:transmembrane protein 19-like n=1 Tax=Dreissena polymorpha TaxID=45954 RepID=UPI002264B829|nr:transmembrane protein 19-like [Dreissena polymorpha]
MNGIIFLLIVLPISLIGWQFSSILHLFNKDAEAISPMRFLIALLAPYFIARWGLHRKSLDQSGAIAGCVVAFFLTVSNLCFFSALLAFFISGSKVTKFRGQLKKRQEEDFKEGGQRNWVQVFCNGGIAAILSFLYLLDVGCDEKLIDWKRYYSPSWFCMAVLGALSCSCGDTFASEIGSVIGSSPTVRLITDFSKVPRGTNGGISVVGTVASFVGGVVPGLAFYLTQMVCVNEDYLTSSPPQWPIVLVAGIFGLMGSMIDSLLGATLQYTGYDKKTQRVVGQPGPGVEDICGTDFLDNHGVNLMASLITALLAPRVALPVWTALT